MNKTIFIRKADLKDVDQLIALNRAWYKSNRGNNFKDGFLSVMWTIEDLNSLIADSLIIVAVSEDQVIGYYLINHLSKAYQQYANIDYLIARGHLPSDTPIGYGAQALVIREYQGLGIRERMLSELVEVTKGTFKLLFSTISKDNPRAFKAHSKDGWEIIHEDEARYYVILTI